VNRPASGLALLAGLACASPVPAAQTADSLTAPPAVVAAAPGADTTHSASRALRRSLVLPGWGQVTNGQAAKAPFVAAALVGAAGVLVYQQRRYTLYQRSALFAGCRESPDRDVCADVSGAADEWEATGSPTFAQAAAVRNQTRGRRDLSGLAVAVVYALQALDAYVAAQLIGFDVGEDVAVQAAPGGLALRVRL
jgi:hypothetical protein